eukprot:scaffold1411_cov252-Pinguiococcus_pyrenoidosus.AAC.21
MHRRRKSTTKLPLALQSHLGLNAKGSDRKRARQVSRKERRKLERQAKRKKPSERLDVAELAPKRQKDGDAPADNGSKAPEERRKRKLVVLKPAKAKNSASAILHDVDIEREDRIIEGESWLLMHQGRLALL